MESRWQVVLEDNIVDVCLAEYCNGFWHQMENATAGIKGRESGSGIDQ